jgi:hypothetical protein
MGSRRDMAQVQNPGIAPEKNVPEQPGDIAMTAELQAAIDHAYGVFAAYSERFTVVVCACCVNKADWSRLLKLPLRQIDGYLLHQYSWSAHGHDNNGPRSDDLRYLLPRYFELFALNDAALYNIPECNLTKLGHTDYRSVWPSVEIAAIDRYFDALLSACLANEAIDSGWPGFSGSGYRCALHLDDIISMLIRAGADVARLLQTWDAASDPAAALHMANMRYCLQTDGGGTRLSNAFLNPDFGDAALAIGAFVTSSRSIARIEAAFFQSTDPAAQHLLSDALFLA